MRVQKTIGWLLALTPLLALFSCESDTMPDSQQGELVPVTIRLGVEGSGLATRNSAGELEGEDEDAILAAENTINTVTVYIVNSDGSHIVLNTDDFDGTSHIATVELTTGFKTVYAVANYPEEDEEEKDITLENLGNNIAVNAIQKITDEHQFIPMSASTTWNVTSSDTYEVNLIRMVAKMSVTILDKRENQLETRAGEKHSLTISDFLPDKTNLLRESHGQVTLPENVEPNEWSWSEIEYITTEDAEGSVPTANFGNFYLHETTGTFNITLDAGEGEGNERKASFNKKIPRNHYFPLVIHITDYALAISGSYEYAPIGVTPIKAEVSPTDEYNVQLPEGASNVNITVKLKENGQEVTSGVTWDYPDDEESPFTYSVSDDGVLNIKAQAIPAVPTGEFTLTATYEGRDHTFEMKISIVDLNTTTRSASPEASPIIIEL